jgi:DNA-binding IclR family transcriptional regulator
MAPRPAQAGAAAPQRRGIQSVDRGLVLLAVLADARAPMTLSALADGAGIAPSHAHRFLASFVRAGLAAQDARSARYDLGPLARRIGLAALQRSDVLDAALRALPELVESTGFSALVGVWSDRGPTIVHWQRSEPAFATSLALGSVLSATGSATGLALLAGLAPKVVAKVIAAERADATAVQARLADVRARGIARVDGSVIPGLAAVAAPLVDWQGQAVAAVTLVGHAGALPATAQRALKNFCQAMSAQAGTGDEATTKGPRR